jgi:hypothetical protein
VSRVAAYRVTLEEADPDRDPDHDHDHDHDPDPDRDPDHDHDHDPVRDRDRDRDPGRDLSHAARMIAALISAFSAVSGFRLRRSSLGD